MVENNPRTRVYVAGAYSGSTVLEILDNMRIGMKAAKDLLRQGYAPYCPWLDYQYQLMLDPNETLTVDDYYQYSLSWLAVADAMLVVDNPRNEKSVGLKKELEFALLKRIPIWIVIGEIIHRPPIEGGYAFKHMPQWLTDFINSFWGHQKNTPAESKLHPLVVGNKVMILNGATIGQDMNFCRWSQDETVFTVKEILSGGEEKYKLEAPGYGETGNYGNGHVYVYRRDLISIPAPVDYVGLMPMDDDCPIAEDDPVLNAFGRFDSKCDDIIRSRSVHNVGTTPAAANTIDGILDPVTSYLGHHRECTERLYSAIRRKAPKEELVELVCDAVNYLRFAGSKMMEGE